MNSTQIQNSTELDQFTEFGIPIRNLWHMLLYAWNQAPMLKYWHFEIDNSPTLDALLALILAKLIQQRLRIGLGCSYIDEERALRGIRGRVDFTKSLKHHTFERGQACCRFQQFSVNAPKNQIIRSTLARLVQTGHFGPDRAQADDLRHNLRRVTRTLEGIDLIELKLDFIRRQQLSRNDADYRLMLSICELILIRQMPTESPGKNVLPSLNRNALILHQVYERFVATFYRIHLPDWIVSPQPRLSWFAKNLCAFLPSMQPDLVMQNKASGHLIVLDTKFTAQSLLTNQYGKQIFVSSHLYQLYAYLRSQEHLSEQHRAATGILLYPAVRIQLSETIELQNHPVRIECIDLTTPWPSIEDNLLSLISSNCNNNFIP